MSRQSLALAALCSLATWLIATTPLRPLQTITAEPGKDLNCIILDGLSVESLEKEMTTLVFSSRSTVITGTANLKGKSGSSGVGYACGW